ncbi:hypothetical protein [Luteimonas aquatica]|uniref:hypothetical protein n=1 Tax=Luteimonas aquatica TaxID=450364 RepID=UPI001F588EE1|nr:hypothetical protein [Luteimonas aquatica]
MLLVLAIGAATSSAHAQPADSQRGKDAGASSQQSSSAATQRGDRGTVLSIPEDTASSRLGLLGTVTPQWGYQCRPEPDGGSTCCWSDAGGRHCSTN